MDWGVDWNQVLQPNKEFLLDLEERSRQLKRGFIPDKKWLPYEPVDFNNNEDLKVFLEFLSIDSENEWIVEQRKAIKVLAKIHFGWKLADKDQKLLAQFLNTHINSATEFSQPVVNRMQKQGIFPDHHEKLDAIIKVYELEESGLDLILKRLVRPKAPSSDNIGHVKLFLDNSVEFNCLNIFPKALENAHKAEQLLLRILTPFDPLESRETYKNILEPLLDSIRNQKEIAQANLGSDPQLA